MKRLMRMNRLPVGLYTIYVGLVFFFFMFLYLPLIVLPLLFKSEGNKLSFYGLRLWAKTFRLLSGIRYEIRGRELLEASQSYIFTPNHTSYLDIPALPLTAHHAYKALAKKEIARIPFFGLLARAVTVMVDRSSVQNRRKSLTKLTKALKAGTNLVVFAEGTINKTGAPLAPFQDGAFRIAVETGTPVVPVVILGAAGLMPARSKLIRPGKIVVEVLPPHPTAGLALNKVKPLKEKIFQQMEEKIREYQAAQSRAQEQDVAGRQH